MVHAALSLAAVLAAAQTATPPGRQNVAPKRLLFVADRAYNRTFKDPSGVWHDSGRGEILLCDTGNHRIVVLDDNGRPKAEFMRTVERSGSTKTVPGEPCRVAADSRGDYYIVDILCDYVDVCDYRGRSLRRIHLRDYIAAAGAASDAAGAANGARDVKATTVFVDHRDRLYVASLSRVYVFSRDGQFERAYGSRGTGPGQFTAITSVWVDTAGRLYVTDARGLAVHVIAPDGTVLLAFGQHDAGLTNFGLPAAIATDRRGYIWVADTLRHIVSAFKRTDDKVDYLDYIGALGLRPGELAFPSGLAISAQRMIVVDRVGGRLQCFEL